MSYLFYLLSLDLSGTRIKSRDTRWGSRLHYWWTVPPNYWPLLLWTMYRLLIKLSLVWHIRSANDGSSGTKSTEETPDYFLNSFHSKVKVPIRLYERIENSLGRRRVSVLFNQTCLKENYCLYIYIYIYRERERERWCLQTDTTYLYDNDLLL